MFTGIIEETGIVSTIKHGRASVSLVISAQLVNSDVKIGDSINTNGACLTVTGFTKNSFSVDVMAETMRITNLSLLKSGNRVNLERALKLGDRLGGHMVSGHIDGTGTITQLVQEEIATWFTIKSDKDILKYIIKKGSVAIDGISLTVADISDASFKVSIIPHTAAKTTLLSKKTGDIVNIENDMTAKYIEKFMQANTSTIKREIDLGFLQENGFID
jgi:riboflavin synthase